MAIYPVYMLPHPPNPPTQFFSPSVLSPGHFPPDSIVL